MERKDEFPNLFRKLKHIEQDDTTRFDEILKDDTGEGDANKNISLKVTFTDCWEIDKHIPADGRWLANINHIASVVAPTKEQAFEEIISSLRALAAHQSDITILPTPPTPEPVEKEAVMRQEIKSLEVYFDHFSQIEPKEERYKDAGNLWIAFTDKWNAFKRDFLSHPSPKKEEGELWDEVIKKFSMVLDYDVVYEIVEQLKSKFTINKK